MYRFRMWHSGLKKFFDPEQLSKDQLTILPDGRFINVSGISTELSVIFSYSDAEPHLSTNKLDARGAEIFECDWLLGPDYEMLRVVYDEDNCCLKLQTKPKDLDAFDPDHTPECLYFDDVDVSSYTIYGNDKQGET